jgi:hypothetical protein
VACVFVKSDLKLGTKLCHFGAPGLALFMEASALFTELEI